MKEIEVFENIISERRPVSFVSGKPIGQFLNSNLRYNCLAHVIPKKGIIRLTFKNSEQRNRLLRLNPENIVLVTPYEHILIDFGTTQQREEYEKLHKCSFDEFFSYKERLIETIKNSIDND